jgi:hypothetical protein
VVLVVVDLGCGGGGGRGLVAAEILVLVARSMESQSNTGKKFFPRSASASTGPGSDTRCNDPGYRGGALASSRRRWEVCDGGGAGRDVREKKNSIGFRYLIDIPSPTRDWVLTTPQAGVVARWAQPSSFHWPWAQSLHKIVTHSGLTYIYSLQNRRAKRPQLQTFFKNQTLVLQTLKTENSQLLDHKDSGNVEMHGSFRYKQYSAPSALVNTFPFRAYKKL